MKYIQYKLWNHERHYVGNTPENRAAFEKEFRGCIAEVGETEIELGN